MGIVLTIFGLILLICTDRNYYTKRLYFIYKYTNPPVIKYYYKLINYLKNQLKPITQHNIVVNIFYIIYAIFWLVILAIVFIHWNLDTWNFLFALSISIIFFFIGFAFD